jgi:1,2-phenylacetyl-CoA epoxidase PaaB subunit
LRVLVRGDGAVYTVDEHWKPIRYVGHSGEPADGKDHHCWCVHWGDPESAIPEIVNVYVDRESGQTIIVERAT